MTRREVTHLLVVGAQRCGTTYLHDLLDDHPDITMARPARPEPKVFMSAELAGRGLDWYHRTYFAHADGEQVLGEKSTSYLERPDAAGRAASMLDDPLVLVQLRDPVERAASNWAFSTNGGFEDRPLAEALSDALAGPRPWDPDRTSVSPYAYLERGHYVDYLVPWLERHGDRMRVLFLEDLVADDDAVAEVYRFLEVDNTHRPAALGTRVNASGAGNREDTGLDADLTRRLRGHFGASDRALADLVGRPLPWGEPATIGTDAQ